MAEAVQMKAPSEMEARAEPNAMDPTEALILSNYSRFEAKVTEAESFLDQGNLELAAFHTILAAKIATHAHCGIFASKRLEMIIRRISEHLERPSKSIPHLKSASEVRRVLHIASEVSSVGGLSRMISRWIMADPDRSNSMLLTRYRNATPTHLKEAIEASGGSLRLLNQEVGSILDWATRLRRVARDYDLIVLHIHCEDVIPLIALADAGNLPPVLLLNHADHLFWLGTGSAHAVLNLRDAADQITRNRRGVAAERSLMLPTLVNKTTRKHSKSEARKLLGLEDDELIMISVARGAKYRAQVGPSYADRFVPILKQNKKARLIVVGSGMPDSWQEAAKSTGGRIVGLPEQPDPWRYFEAADIYVDSYPFSSSTSLMEAAGYELPLITLFTAPDDARLVGINHLGLVGGVLQTRSPAEWEDTISRLLTDDNFRQSQGALAKEAVKIAQPEGWKVWLERAYQDALSLPPLIEGALAMPDSTDTPYFGEPDRRHQSIYGSDACMIDIERDYIGFLSLKGRLRMARKLSAERQAGSDFNTLRALIPEWLKAQIRRARNGSPW